MKRKMTALMTAAMTICMLCSCGQNTAETADGTDTVTDDEITADAAESTDSEAEEAGTEEAAGAEESEDSASEEPVTVYPLPASVDPDNMTDCTVHVSFSADDFNWRGGNLQVEVYDEELFDAVEVSKLKVGDTVVAEGQDVVIQTLTDYDYCLMINEELPDQTMLAPGDGGTYYIMGYDDVVGMSDLGHAEVILSQDVTLNDCGEMPEDAYEITSDNVKAYIDELSDSRRNFDCQSTVIVIENGLVTEIDRSWRP